MEFFWHISTTEFFTMKNVVEVFFMEKLFSLEALFFHFEWFFWNFFEGKEWFYSLANFQSLRTGIELQLTCLFL